MRIESDFLSPAEVSANLRVHERTVQRLIAAGSLKATRIGKQWRVREADLDAYVAEGMNRRQEHEVAAVA